MRPGPDSVARNNGVEHRRRLGLFGEDVAAAFLKSQGVRIIARNVNVGRGEIDLIAVDSSGRFVVEVKSAVARPDDHPRFHFTEHKARQVAQLARSQSIRRVDLVTVVVASSGVQVDWHRRVA